MMEMIDYVYMLREVGGYRVKIGRSRDPQGRMRSIQTSCPFELELVGTIEVTNYRARKIEKSYHQLCQKYRTKGEWFDLPLTVLLDLKRDFEIGEVTQELVVDLVKPTTRPIIKPATKPITRPIINPIIATPVTTNTYQVSSKLKNRKDFFKNDLSDRQQANQFIARNKQTQAVQVDLYPTNSQLETLLAKIGLLNPLAIETIYTMNPSAIARRLKIGKSLAEKLVLCIKNKQGSE